MKKIFISSLAITLMASTMVTASATISNEKDVELYEAEKYAYMDIDEAPEYLKDDILEARNKIIFSKGWTANGVNGYVYNLETGEKLYDLPTFSELFPDWDIPKLSFDESNNIQSNITSEKILEPETIEPLSKSTRKTDTIIYKNVYLKNPPPNSITPAFVTYDYLGPQISAGPYQLYASETANIAISNEDTGEVIAYEVNLSPKNIVYGFVPFYMGRFNAGIRASTYSSPGYADIFATYELAEPL